MPAAARPKKIDDILDRAADALAHRRPFEAERLAHKALMMGREAGDFERMAKVIPTLKRARQLRLEAARQIPAVNIVAETVTEETHVEPGCYLVQPPRVGADGRRLRLLALSREIPVLVVSREPLTQLGFVPVVAITPGLTLRAKVEPMDDPDHPDLDWLLRSLDDLGNFAIDSIDPEIDPVKRVDALLQRLDALPEHDRLHDALVAACETAHRAGLEPQPSS